MGRLHRGFDDGRGLEKSRARVRRAMMGRAHGRVVVVVEGGGGSSRRGSDVRWRFNLSQDPCPREDEGVPKEGEGERARAREKIESEKDRERRGER
jgi:hypothetical protein